jgi:hypothetical protein
MKQLSFIFLLIIMYTIVISIFQLSIPFNGCLDKSHQSVSIQHQSQAGEDFDFKDDILTFINIPGTYSSQWERQIVENLIVKKKSNWINADSEDLLKERRDKRPLLWRQVLSAHCNQNSDYTESKNCIMSMMNNRIRDFNVGNNGIVHFMTILRDPISRYASEFEDIRTHGKQ